MRQTVLPLCVSAIVILFISPPAAAQQVGARQYTVADGLADNFIEALLEDSHGYMWFATREGLSRFDGYSFKNYTTADGLPGSWIRDVAEDAHGNIWVATSRGMVRLVDDGFPNARAPVRFDPAPGLENRDAHPGALIAQLGGWIWGLAAGGIFRGKPDAGGKAVFERFSSENSGLADPRMFRDREGRLWIMLDHVLVVLAPDGHELARYGPEHGIGRNWIVSVAQDRSGRIYAANQFELFSLESGPVSGSRWQKLPLRLRSGTSEMRWLGFDLSNRLWIGTTRGVMWWQDGITTELSLSPGPASWVEVGLVDRHGNVWIGTHGQGVFRVPPEPILSLNERHGLPPGTVTHIIEDVDGRIYATSEFSGLVEVTAGRILPIPGTGLAKFTNVRDRAERDRQGQWWIGTIEGKLFWLPAERPDFNRARFVWSAPAHPIDTAWTGPHLVRLPDGSILVGGSKARLFRALAERGEPRLELVPGSETFENVRHATLDRAGNLWLAGISKLARWSEGKIEVIDVPTGGAAPDPWSAFVDSRGWLWVGLGRLGVAVTREPGAARPHFELYTTANGLSSNLIYKVTEDRRGRIYLGTSRGLDRLDPATGVVRRLGVQEGLAGATVYCVITDRHGRIWAATSGGISLMNVDDVPVQQPVPPVFLTGVRVAGQDRPVPERGARELGGLHIAYNENNLVIEWVAIPPAGDATVRYQYRLEGYDKDWSPPATSRSITYAGLGSGTYRFDVRALHAGTGAATGSPATLQFSVAAPLWRQPWFLAVAVLAVTATGAWIHRVRLRQALAMERLRRQVAFDLHDDVGSGLSEIAILSELGRESLNNEQAWSEIAQLARSLRDSMGDIVWAVDPRHDSLGDLVSRMRQVAYNLLEAQGINVSFQAPSDPHTLAHTQIAPDRRRHLLLIYKEAVHNVAKHAQARHVSITMELLPNRLRLSIEDDGRGFDGTAPKKGHGLHSMRRRAEALGAGLDIRSSSAGGTRLELAAPI